MVSLFHLIILILLVYSNDKFSHGAKDVGGVTGLDIHRDKYGAINPDWAFDYVSNINIQHQQNKNKRLYTPGRGTFKTVTAKHFYYCC